MSENVGIRKESAAMRKCNKPLMEKRRRARINECLTQLKTLVLQALRKDSSQFSKLEKADILELTVKHLRTLQRGQLPVAMVTEADLGSKYKAGFNECANEVMRFLARLQDVDGEVRNRLVGHLANCLKSVPAGTPSVPAPTAAHQGRCLQPISVQIPQVPPTSLPVKPLPESPTPLSSASLPPTPIAQAQSPASVGYQGQITGAFHIVPNSLCGGGAVAVYLGAPASSSAATAMTSAVPVYSLQVPSSVSGPTAFVPPPASGSPMTSPEVKMEVRDARPLDLKAPRKSDSKIRYQPYSNSVTCGGQAGSSLAEDKVWRPW